ncbi:MAG: hypothetical protein WB763_08745 [Terriglobia bacterium]|jgi:hypothetical protein
MWNTLRGTELIDYPAYKKVWMNLNNVSSLKWTPVHCEYIVLAKDLAISAWVGKTEMITKSGEKIIIDPQDYTDVYKKVGDKWKVIYEHTSGTAVTQKAAKK